MTWTAIHPLLKGDDFFGAIVVFVIWGVLALLSQIGKWQEKKRKQQQMHMPPHAAVPTGLQLPPQRPQQQRQRPDRRPVQPPRRMPAQPPRQPVQAPTARLPVYTPPPARAACQQAVGKDARRDRSRFGEGTYDGAGGRHPRDPLRGKAQLSSKAGRLDGNTAAAARPSRSAAVAQQKVGRS